MEDSCRPCEIAVAVGAGLSFCDDNKLQCDALKAVNEYGYDDEQEVRDALLNMAEQVTDDKRIEALAIICSAFPSEEGCDIPELKEV